MSYLCTISGAFYDVLRSVHVAGQPLRIVLYVDECCPGNPLRPEKSRSIHCIYWTFVDFPQWLLCRTGTWFVFAFIRDVLVCELPGGLSQLMRSVLRKFFGASGHSYGRGIVVEHKGANLMVTCIFAGFLADDSAHKYIASVKGASGSCDN